MAETVIAAAGQMALLAALLDHETPPWREGTLPPLGHWLLFPPTARQSALGPDGHPLRAPGSVGAELPRRMWAGGRLRFLSDVPLGQPIERATHELNVAHKDGRSGPMVFVTLRHEIRCGGVLAIEEEQDIVYRAAAPQGPVVRPPLPTEPLAPAPGSRRLAMDPVALFRFSALTFNAHRIHYDRDYAAQIEGYPGLVVHGPLIATLLMDHLLRSVPGAAVRGFAFRASRPIFDGEPFDLSLTREGDGAGATLAAIDRDGGLAMQAEAVLA
jgi:3-methylfumaryl-CoA hydratase